MDSCFPVLQVLWHKGYCDCLRDDSVLRLQHSRVLAYSGTLLHHPLQHHNEEADHGMHTPTQGLSDVQSPLCPCLFLLSTWYATGTSHSLMERGSIREERTLILRSDDVFS